MEETWLSSGRFIRGVCGTIQYYGELLNGGPWNDVEEQKTSFTIEGDRWA